MSHNFWYTVLYIRDETEMFKILVLLRFRHCLAFVYSLSNIGLFI